MKPRRLNNSFTAAVFRRLSHLHPAPPELSCHRWRFGGALIILGISFFIGSAAARAQSMDVGSWTVGRTLVVEGPVTVEGSLNVAGDVFAHGPMEGAFFETLPPGALSFQETREPRQIRGALTVHGSLTVHGDLSVRGPLSVKGPVRVGGVIDATGPISERYPH